MNRYFTMPANGTLLYNALQQLTEATRCTKAWHKKTLVTLFTTRIFSGYFSPSLTRMKVSLPAEMLLRPRTTEQQTVYLLFTKDF